MRQIIRLISILILLAAPAFTGSAMALDVRGNLFVEGGKPVRLKGVAMGDVGDLPADENPYPEIARDWGANIVRLSIHPGFWRDDAVGALSRDRKSTRLNSSHRL